mgnify:CR=1 FL=1
MLSRLTAGHARYVWKWVEPGGEQQAPCQWACGTLPALWQDLNRQKRNVPPWGLARGRKPNRRWPKTPASSQRRCWHRHLQGARGPSKPYTAEWAQAASRRGARTGGVADRWALEPERWVERDGKEGAFGVLGLPSLRDARFHNINASLPFIGVHLGLEWLLSNG